MTCQKFHSVNCKMNQLVVYCRFCMYFVVYVCLLKGKTGRRNPVTASSFTKYPYIGYCNIIMITYTMSLTRWSLGKLVVFSGLHLYFC